MTLSSKKRPKDNVNQLHVDWDWTKNPILNRENIPCFSCKYLGESKTDIYGRSYRQCIVRNDVSMPAAQVICSYYEMKVEREENKLKFYKITYNRNGTVSEAIFKCKDGEELSKKRLQKDVHKIEELTKEEFDKLHEYYNSCGFSVLFERDGSYSVVIMTDVMNYKGPIKKLKGKNNWSYFGVKIQTPEDIKRIHNEYWGEDILGDEIYLVSENYKFIRDHALSD